MSHPEGDMQLTYNYAYLLPCILMKTSLETSTCVRVSFSSSSHTVLLCVYLQLYLGSTTVTPIFYFHTPALQFYFL